MKKVEWKKSRSIRVRECTVLMSKRAHDIMEQTPAPSASLLS